MGTMLLYMIPLSMQPLLQLVLKLPKGESVVVAERSGGVAATIFLCHDQKIIFLFLLRLLY